MCDRQENKALSIQEEQAQALSVVIEKVMGPLFAGLAQVLQTNTEALTQLSNAQQVQNDRLAALEREVRMNTLVTQKQVQYFNTAIRDRARELLAKNCPDYTDSPKLAKMLTTAIRKNVLMRYGVGALHEIQRHEYEVVISQINTWNAAATIMEVRKAARALASAPAQTESLPAGR